MPYKTQLFKMRLIFIILLFKIKAFAEINIEQELNQPTTQQSNGYQRTVQQMLLTEENMSKYFNSTSHTPLTMKEEDGKMEADVTWNILLPYARGCQFHLITDDSRRFPVFYIVKFSSDSYVPTVLYDIMEHDMSGRGGFKRGVIGTCQVFVLYITSEDITPWTRFLNEIKLWLMPEAKIILLGKRKTIQSFLWMSLFRNSVHVLYLAFEKKGSWMYDEITAYSLCLFCNKESGRMQVLAAWHGRLENPKISNPFPNDVKNLHEGLLKVTALPYFPYIDYKLNIKEFNKPVTLQDSADKRVIEILSSVLNFTYEVHQPPNLSFGVRMKNGSWTGMVGALQREEADLTFIMTTAAGRLPIMDLGRLTESDRLVIVSLKPKILPQYLVIARPFAVNVWMYIFLSIIMWGVSLWIFGQMRSKFTSERRMTLNWSIFYSFAVILEDPPLRPPTNSSSRMLVAWWLIASLVISTGFKSSLVANLSVPGKNKPIDRIEDLTNQDKWHWGIHDSILTGQTGYFFKMSKDVNVRHVHANAEAISVERGLAKAVQGQYSFLGTRIRVTTTVLSMYTDKYGRVFMHMSKTGYKVMTDLGWGFRKGAPFYNLFMRAFNHLIEAGLYQYWIEDVIATKTRELRKEKSESGTAEAMHTLDIDSIFESDEIVLKMRHLTGVYLIVSGAYTVAFLIFLAEKLIDSYHKKNKTSTSKD